MEQTTEQTAGRAAAEWWAEQLGAPLFKAVRGDEPRDEREPSELAGMMASIVASRNPVQDGQGEAFVAALSLVIDERLATNGWGLSLGVDYGPALELAEAARAAGIHTGRFPWKTNMWIKRDHVTAALGYGARARLIWSAPDWERPPCGQHHYDDEAYVLEANEVCAKPIYHEDDCGDWQPDPARCVECDGTYVDHFGRDRQRLGHSYRTKAAS